MASRGPTADRDIRASTSRQIRHFQQPSIGKPVQPMQMRPATALLRKAAFHNLFRSMHLTRRFKKEGRKKKPEGVRAAGVVLCKWGVYFGKLPSLATSGRAQRPALLRDRTSEEGAPPRVALPAFPRRHRQEPKRPLRRQQHHQPLSPPATLAPRGRSAPRGASCYLPRPLIRLRPRADPQR